MGRFASRSRRMRKSATARTTSTSRGSARGARTRMDGGRRGEIETESFSADAMTVTFHGFNTHPGYAKGRMVNAIKIAAAFIDRLPHDELSPETTDGHEGFVHPYVVQAAVERTSVRLLVRDFDTAGLKREGSDARAARARGGCRAIPGRVSSSRSRSRIAT